MLRAEAPIGPLQVYSERLAPEDWTCIDDTIHFEDGIPYLIFPHFFEDTPDGDMCILKLSSDMKKAEGEAALLF